MQEQSAIGEKALLSCISHGKCCREEKAFKHLLVVLCKGVFSLICGPDFASRILVALHPVLQLQVIGPGRVVEGLPPPSDLQQ